MDKCKYIIPESGKISANFLKEVLYHLLRVKRTNWTYALSLPLTLSQLRQTNPFEHVKRAINDNEKMADFLFIGIYVVAKRLNFNK